MVAQRHAFRKNRQILTPVRRLVASPRQFERIIEKYGDNIRATSVIPPRLGGSGFGEVRVEFLTPVLM